MNTKLSLFALPVILFAGTAQAAPLPACTASTTSGACVVNFDDSASRGFFRVDPAAVGFDFENVTGTSFAGFSNVAAATNSSTVAYNFGGLSGYDKNDNKAVSTFSVRGGEQFDLTSFVMAAGTTAKSVTVTGFGSNGTVYEASLDLTTTAATYNFGWTNLDSFSIWVSPPRLPEEGTYWAMNGVSVVVASTVPEPETYAMLLAGLGLMGVVIRRRNRA